MDYQKLLDECNLIETERLILRPFKPDDFEDILEIWKNPNSTKYTIWSGVSDFDKAYENFESFNLSTKGLYAIELKEQNKVIGDISLALEPEHDKASFGYMLNEKFWCNGYMTEALVAILGISFEKLGLNRVAGDCFSANIGSANVMKKAGMTFEGMRKEFMKIRGQYIDIDIFGITKSDWDKLQA